MSTAMTTKYFVSYRRSPARKLGDVEATRLRDALRDRGLETWRDLDDLAPEPTEAELTAVLQDSAIAGAVMLISPEVAGSSVIRNVEARRIFQRKAQDSAFLVRPVLLGLEYAQANNVLGAPAGFQDVNDWNLRRVPGGELTDDDAKSVARDVLWHRTRALASLSGSSALAVGLFSRRVAGVAELALRFDYSDYFTGRSCADGTFDTMQNALLDAATSIAENVPGRLIVGQGNASLPVGALFGAVFSPLAGFDLAWMQPLAGSDPGCWSHSVAPSGTDPSIATTYGDPTSNDIVLAIGVSANIEESVADYLRATDTKFRTAMHVMPSDGPVSQGVALTPADGVAIVIAAIDAARRQREDLGMTNARLHLFLACPLGMAVLLGQKLNTFGECILYEHDPSERPNYRRVHAFNPSGFSYTRAR